MPRSARFPTFPSVTEILADVGLAGDYRHAPAEALQRGQGLHRAIELHRQGRLDRSSLHPELEAPFAGYLAFCEAWRYQPMAGAAECELVDPGLGVVGHIDDAGGLTDPQSGAQHQTCLVDYKLTDRVDLASARRQLAGYRLLWSMGVVERCYVLQLLKGGGFRVHDVTDDYAQNEFRAALVVFRAKRGGRR